MQLNDAPADQVTAAIAEIRAVAEGLAVAAPAEVAAREKRLTRLALYLETFVRDEIPPPPSLFQATRSRLDIAVDRAATSPYLPEDDPVASPPEPNRAAANGR